MRDPPERTCGLACWRSSCELALERGALGAELVVVVDRAAEEAALNIEFLLHHGIPVDGPLRRLVEHRVGEVEEVLLRLRDPAEHLLVERLALLPRAAALSSCSLSLCVACWCATSWRSSASSPSRTGCRSRPTTSASSSACFCASSSRSAAAVASAARRASSSSFSAVSAAIARSSSASRIFFSYAWRSRAGVEHLRVDVRIHVLELALAAAQRLALGDERVVSGEVRLTQFNAAASATCARSSRAATCASVGVSRKVRPPPPPFFALGAIALLVTALGLNNNRLLRKQKQLAVSSVNGVWKRSPERPPKRCPGSHCANFARRRTLLLVLCNLLWASTYEYGAPQELTRGSVPDLLADAYSQSPLYPPIRPGAARLGCRTWGRLRAALVGRAARGDGGLRRVFSSRRRSSLRGNARHPDCIDLDGEALESCALAQDARGRWKLRGGDRLVVGRLRRPAAGAWDVVQGGYAGHALYSNGSAVSGVQLWYPHRDDGALQLVDLPSHVRPPKPIELPDDGDDAAEEADEAAIAKAAAMQAAYDAFDPDAPRAPRARLAPWRRRFVETACDHMLPGPEDADGVAPEITGHYFSNYNESVAVCTANGSLVGAFSGLGEHQGLLTARWNGRRRRWGAIALPDGADTFAWQVRPDGALAGDLRDGLTGWTLHNRTWDFVSVNGSVPDPWNAARQADVGGNPQARALGEGPPFAGSLEPRATSCAAVAAPECAPAVAATATNSGGRRRRRRRCRRGRSSTARTPPRTRATTSTTHVQPRSPKAGSMSRARVEELSTWSDEEILVPHTGLDIPRVVVSPLTLGDRPRSSASHHCCRIRLSLATAAGASCGRCLKLLPKSECPRVPDLPLRCDVAPGVTRAKPTASAAPTAAPTTAALRPLCGDLHRAGRSLRVGPRSPWTSPHVVALSGARGRPSASRMDHVTAHGLTLHWEAPFDKSATPPLARLPRWHAHGGGRFSAIGSTRAPPSR